MTGPKCCLNSNVVSQDRLFITGQGHSTDVDIGGVNVDGSPVDSGERHRCINFPRRVWGMPPQ